MVHFLKVKWILYWCFIFITLVSPSSRVGRVGIIFVTACLLFINSLFRSFSWMLSVGWWFSWLVHSFYLWGWNRHNVLFLVHVGMCSLFTNIVLIAGMSVWSLSVLLWCAFFSAFFFSFLFLFVCVCFNRNNVLFLFFFLTFFFDTLWCAFFSPFSLFVYKQDYSSSFFSFSFCPCCDVVFQQMLVWISEAYPTSPPPPCIQQWVLCVSAWQCFVCDTAALWLDNHLAQCLFSRKIKEHLKGRSLNFFFKLSNLSLAGVVVDKIVHCIFLETSICNFSHHE